MTPQTEKSSPERSGPWWRYPHVWLVVGLPLVAVIASFITLYFAISAGKNDATYSDPRHPQDGSPAHLVPPHLLPAEDARNHAATGGLGAPGLDKSPPSGPGGGNAPADN